jgi:hypothetical protein
LGPTVKDFSYQSAGTVGSIFTPRHFKQELSGRQILVRTDKYHNDIFNQSPRGHQVPILSPIDKKAPFVGKQALSFSQSNTPIAATVWRTYFPIRSRDQGNDVCTRKLFSQFGGAME